MNDFLQNLGKAIDQRLRGPGVSALLRRFDIDPKRYWLLVDLFSKLSERREVTGDMGRQEFALKLTFGIFFLASVGGSIVAVVVQPAPASLLLIYLGITTLLLIGVLLAEAANSLVNPVEGLVLAHQPINGATYTSAKLSHLLRIVLVFVGALNIAPAVAGLFLKNASWFQPILHLSVALLLGIILALATCGVFGWLFRFVPARKLKQASQFVQGIPIAIVVFPKRPLLNWLRPRIQWLLDGPLQGVPLWPFVAVVVCGFTVMSFMGLRMLTADYLIRASSIAHGSSNIRTTARRSWMGELVQRLFGGQISRAGFDYTRRLMRREWQFRRQLLSVLPLLFFTVGGIVSGMRTSPFSNRFTAAHLIPHLFGVVLFAICAFLQFGTDYKAIWVFQLVPDRAFFGFARGVHTALWMTFAVIPHLVILLVFPWNWGILDVLLFVPFSLGVVSIYLAFAMKAIKGVPFGKQMDPTRMAGVQSGLLFGMIGFMILVAISVGLQWIVFHSYLAVAVLDVILGVSAAFLTRWSLHNYEASIRYNLSLESSSSTLVYTEVETL